MKKRCKKRKKKDFQELVKQLVLILKEVLLQNACLCHIAFWKHFYAFENSFLVTKKNFLNYWPIYVTLGVRNGPGLNEPPTAKNKDVDQTAQMIRLICVFLFASGRNLGFCPDPKYSIVKIEEIY